jgi:hypothetical protein
MSAIAVLKNLRSQSNLVQGKYCESEQEFYPKFRATAIKPIFTWGVLTLL